MKNIMDKELYLKCIDIAGNYMMMSGHALTSENRRIELFELARALYRTAVMAKDK